MQFGFCDIPAVNMFQQFLPAFAGLIKLETLTGIDVGCINDSHLALLAKYCKNLEYEFRTL